MEYFDVLDELGNITGKKIEREKAHKEGIWHRIVRIWLINSMGEVLIQRRSSIKDIFPNMWAMSCEGHVSSGQGSKQSALRELKEELGLTLEPEEIKLVFTHKRGAKYSDNFIGNHFIDVYVAKKDIDLSELTIQKEEVSEIKWINLDDYINSIKTDRQNFRDYPDELDRTYKILKDF